mmetsp:Transcript_22728/g.40904  ORF Transcript_22728/g.40904 Transcript_22728/m.40904 type:complete len:503 (-) Transcript_22728:313-1821(-)
MALCRRSLANHAPSPASALRGCKRAKGSSHIFPQAPKWVNEVQHPYQPLGWANIVKTLHLNCAKPGSPLATVRQGFVPDGELPEGWRLVPASNVEHPLLLEDHFALAMELEGPNLSVLAAAINHKRHGELVQETIKSLVKVSRNHDWGRRLWFLYEWMRDERIEVDDLADTVAYIDMLDPDEYYTTLPIKSARHRVRDNFLGCAEFCPMVRRTARLDQHASHAYGQTAHHLLKQYGHMLERDYSYDMVLQETIHSMTIEGVHYDSYDMPLLVKTLMKHGNLDDKPLTEETVQRYILPAVMGETVLPDETYKYRDEQVYVSETICTVDDTKDVIHFVAARSRDCPSMLQGLFKTLNRVMSDLAAQPNSIDCVVAASVIGFGFVFIHPFEDGNGRVHRFMIQQALRRFGYVPQMLFPLSRVMVREPDQYMACLEQFDRQIMPHVLYTIQGDGRMEILNETDHLYRYFDGTAMSEYLYVCVQTCVLEDLPTYCLLLQNTWDHVHV